MRLFVLLALALAAPLAHAETVCTGPAAGFEGLCATVSEGGSGTMFGVIVGVSDPDEPQGDYEAGVSAQRTMWGSTAYCMFGVNDGTWRHYTVACPLP